MPTSKPGTSLFRRSLRLYMSISLDQNKLFVSESLAPLTQLAKWYKEPTIQFLEL